MNHDPVRIPDWALPTTNQKCFLAISGGIDSCVLLHLLLAAEVRPTLLHVNYRLREEDSNADEEFVRKLAEDHHLRLLVYRVSDRELSELKGKNLQLTARQIRYRFFHENLTENDLCYLAHHADDQAETLLMQIIKGARWLESSGMLEQRSCFIRPLLAHVKSDLLKYAEEHQLQWCEDKSNHTNAYFRNLIRNDWFNSISKHVPTIREDLTVLGKALQNTKNAIQNTLKPVVKEIKQTNFIKENTWGALSEEEKECLIKSLDWPSHLVQDLNELFLSNRSSKKEALSIQKVFHRVVDGISFQDHLPHVENKPHLLIESMKSLPDRFNKSELYLDKDKIKGSIFLRPWTVGDRISPVGMKGTQLISDILKDAKVEADKKRNFWILCDDEHVLWVPGLKVSRKATAHQKSREIIKIRLHD